MSYHIIVIAGPTAAGKTAVGIRLAQAIGGEIISADSRQIYRYMDIGTAKPTQEERAEVPHHLLDIVDPDTPFSAAEFSAQAASKVEGILARGRNVVVVGGAGFYLEALFEGLSPVPSVPSDLKNRIAERVASDVEGAYDELKRIDPETGAALKISDRQRIGRALEVHAHSGRPISYFQKLPRVPGTERKPIRFCLAPTRETLYARINLRTTDMIEGGFIDETKSLFDRGYDRQTYALKTFGYREIGAHLSGDLGLSETIALIQQGTRRYAKRQLTWFRNRSEMTRLDPGEADPVRSILDAITA
jgi:tRNA dimethylallyltransferase